MKKCALALLVGSALTSSAYAADLAPAAAPIVKAPALMSPAPVANWTGFYIGGNVGGSWGHISQSNSSVTTDGSLTTGVPGFNAGTFPGPDRSYDLDASFAGGFQVGYNYEFENHVVLGVEGDFSWTGNKGDDSFNASAQGPTYSTSVKADWFATLRGRLGYSFGQFLPFVTGGVAWAHTSSTVTDEPWTALGGAGPSPADPHFSASSSSIATGYAIGAGLEYALTPHWSIRGEYMHLGFANKGYDFNFGGTVGTAHADAKMDFDIARLGVNYRF
jgi:outer membrane immunogenic protein